MSFTYKYAAYPSAKVYDKDGNQIQHLLWGDWVRIDGEIKNNMYPVHTRGISGFMFKDDLQEEKLLDIIFVDVGQGDGCLVVTPNDEKIIIDAGVSDNMYRYLKWRFNFLGGPRKLDMAIITHPDKDHYNGYKPIFNDENVKFNKIYHNGIMEHSSSKPFGKEKKINNLKYITELIENRIDLENFLSTPSNYGRKLYANLLKDGLKTLDRTKNNIKMLYSDGEVDNPTFLSGFDDSKEFSIQILSPIIDRDEENKKMLRWFRTKPVGGSYDKGKTKNGHSIVLKLVYKNVSILLGGDLNSSSEARLLSKYTGIKWPPIDCNEEKTMIQSARIVFESDISKCCHHGSADFTDTFLQAVNSAATVISSGDEESHAHPRSDTLGAIGLHGRGWRPLILSTELARSTREDEGDKNIKIGKILSQIELEQDNVKKEKLINERNKLIEELTKRNVTVYGAITLRTDGNKVIMAYKLEKSRTNKSRGKKTLSKWDIYKMERVANGPINYVK
ncbi:hypothetical protein MY04_2100 [Flammeovirga sp. MY04]|uniref:ComEC/Rec2 family competence protein n=1 Tax=Flammeovirga sp. MY04 TaxID=1191459 RepID=UPI0008061871|nr:hypothetical protein [Flammeovirga sp. MY04]ANQ49474.1 hypothetical protein MY04_2100 [Flammeovirga sp. MY04]